MYGPPVAKKASIEAKLRTDEEVAPGIFKGADGRLYTAIPQNELANLPPWGVWSVYQGKGEDWVDVII